MFTVHESLRLFPLGLPQRLCVLYQLACCSEVENGIEAVAEETIGDMLHCTVDNFVVHLQ